MYILVAYDVDTTDKAGVKRLRQVAKICQNNGVRVQNSVFECLVSPAQKVEFEASLLAIIDQEKDSLRIYHMGHNYQEKISAYGLQKSFEIEGELII